MSNFLYVIFSINIISFIMMGIDKIRAKHHRWRISETTLLSFAAIGGSIGVLTGMILFHHKTRKKKFIYGVPLILVVQFLCFLGYGILNIGQQT